MKKTILMLVVFVLVSAGSLFAQDKALHGSAGVTFDTMYVWRGFDVFGHQAAVHPFIDLNLWGTGFGINVTGHQALESGFETTKRMDYTLYYRNQLFADQCYAMMYELAYVYYNYPQRSSHDTDDTIDLQEIHGVASFPNLLGVEGLVPTYVLVKLWPSSSGSYVGSKFFPGKRPGGTASGFAHIFMLDYAWKVKCPVMGGDRVLNLHSEVVYNDGVDPRGIGVDHDWSNAVFGVSTNFDLGHNMVFTPGVYHQICMDESVNPDKSDTWGTATLRYNF
jgi:hypothetical protein